MHSRVLATNGLCLWIRDAKDTEQLRTLNIAHKTELVKGRVTQYKYRKEFYSFRASA
jgi:hypothetical protein